MPLSHARTIRSMSGGSVARAIPQAHSARRTKLKRADDNPTVGILLCAGKDASLVRYSVLRENEEIFASSLDPGYENTAVAPGNYTLQVVATDGTVSVTQALSLTVQ